MSGNNDDVAVWFSREMLELESQLDAAMRSRRTSMSRSDTQIATTQLQALEQHNTNLQVFTVYGHCVSVCAGGSVV